MQVKKSDIESILGKAAKHLLSYYKDNDLEIDYKKDNSPVTAADNMASSSIISDLNLYYPDVPVICEETAKADFKYRKEWEYCWIVDPLDGTREFIRGSGQFTINIALIKNQEPVFGMIFIPVLDTYYYAFKDKGAFCQKTDQKPIKLPVTDFKDKKKVRFIIGNTGLNTKDKKNIEKITSTGIKFQFNKAGAALKHCYIAEGNADLYIKTGTTYEWDTAPGQLLITESGGKVLELSNKKELTYNRKNLANPPFVMLNKRMLKMKIIDLLD